MKNQSSAPGYVRLSQVFSLLALILLPKCSLCLFAAGTIITVCAGVPQIPPAWEYWLIGSTTLLAVAVQVYKIRARFLSLALVFTLSGSLAIFVFLWLKLSPAVYYIGVAMILASSAIFAFNKFGNKDSSKCCTFKHEKKAP